MRRTIKVMAGSICGLVVAAGGIAYAAPNLTGSAGRTTLVTPQVTTAAARVQTEFAAITPCRILDTRTAVAGLLAPNAARRVMVGGTTGFTAQGGKNGGCGIPTGASAIAASLSATGITGTGIIHAWPTGTSEPSATVVNYNKVAGSVTTGQTLAVTPGTTPGLTIKALGRATHFVIDVTGYYREPITATVESNGLLGPHSSQVVGSRQDPLVPAGVYEVTLDRAADGCVLQVAALTSSAVIALGVIDGTRIGVQTRDTTSGNRVNNAFSLTVTC